MKKKEQTKVQKEKTVTGVVVSTKMTNTIRVKIERFVMHPIYKKAVRRTNTVAVHNEDKTIKEGDTVKIRESKPISKTKHFRVVEKVTL
jgi:small subunit ribosomal protein S17